MWNGDRTVKYNEEQTLLKRKETSGKITKARRSLRFIFKPSTIWFLQGGKRK